MQQDEDFQLLDIEDIATETGRSLRYWQREFSEGRGPAYILIGKTRKIRRAAWREWLLQQEVQPPRDRNARFKQLAAEAEGRA